MSKAFRNLYLQPTHNLAEKRKKKKEQRFIYARFCENAFIKMIKIADSIFKNFL